MVTKRTAQWARETARSYNIPLGADYHTLSSGTVYMIIAAGQEARYRQPRNANGSFGRYFYAYLNRVASA